MKTMKKIEIIRALDEVAKELTLRKEELIDCLFDIRAEAEKVIRTLTERGLIDAEDWGITYLKGKYNSYMQYEREVIEFSEGWYDGGDLNSWIPPTNYEKLLKFCEQSPNIIQEMQEALTEKLDRIEKVAHLKGTENDER